MANVAVDTYCNLRCPYCFADDMIEQQHKNIDMDTFRWILQWIARTPMINHVGIIGGEPTLHPQFREILKEVNTFCRELRGSATLFTNGIMLDQYVPDIGNGIGLLINVNAPENMGPEKWRMLNNTLEHLNLLGWFIPGRAKANIGCNIWADRDNYDFIWEIVDRYQIDHVRCSVSAPITEEYKNRKQWYYAACKPIFLKFVREAEKRGVNLGADCNQIPDCYFTREELELVYKVMQGRHNGICNPVVDITPELTATACFGAYDPVDITDFETLPDLERYLLHKKTYPRVEKNITGKCKGCKNAELLVCQGGCLAFSEVNGIKQVFDTPPSRHNKTTERTGAVVRGAANQGVDNHLHAEDMIQQQNGCAPESCATCGGCGTPAEKPASIKGPVQDASFTEVPANTQSTGYDTTVNPQRPVQAAQAPVNQGQPCGPNGEQPQFRIPYMDNLNLEDNAPKQAPVQKPYEVSETTRPIFQEDLKPVETSAPAQETPVASESANPQEKSCNRQCAECAGPCIWS